MMIAMLPLAVDLFGNCRLEMTVGADALPNEIP